MATNTSLKFFRAAEAPASAALGAIWFNTTDRTIQLKTGDSTWEPYAGKLKDSTWSTDNQTLTITKYDGSSIVLDFSKVADLASVKAAIADAIKPVTDRLDVAEGKITALETKVGAPAVEGESPVAATGLFKAIADEKSARENADTALNGRVDTVEGNLANEVTARQQADTALDGRLSTVEGKVAGLASATHFLGVKNSLEEVTQPANGDIVIVGQKEYVYASSDSSWHEMGDTSSEVGRITDLETRMTTAEGEIDTLQTGLAEEIERAKGAEQANAQAIAAEKERAMAAEQANASAIAQEVTDRQTAITNAIEAIKVDPATTKSSADGKVSVTYSQTNGVVSISEVATSDIASDTELKALDQKVTTMDGSLGQAKGEIDALKALHANKDASSKKSVSEEISEAVDAIAVAENTVGDDKVSVKYSQTKGKVAIEVTTNDIASAAELATAKAGISSLEGRADKLEALHADGEGGAKKSVSAEITEAINALDSNVSYTDNNTLVDASVAEVDGKLSSVSLDTNKLKAELSRIEALIGSSIAGAMVWEEF